MKKLFFIMVLCLFSLVTTACAGSPAQPSDVPPGQATVTVTFDFERQTGHATNQFAVWIENADGDYLKTLYATRFTANGGYKNRPDSLPQWVEKSGLADMSDVDAMTGATPQSGALQYVWDLTDHNGDPMPAGTYRFCVEGTLRWGNRVLYTGEIETGDAASTATAQAQFFYQAAQDQPALSDDAPECGMIGMVTAAYTPGEG